MTFQADLAKLAFDQGTKALTGQVATVDNARARIGVLLGGGNIATAFLGKDAIARGIPVGGPIDPAFAVGTIAFVIFVLACMYGMAPRGGWTFDLDVEEILGRGKPDGGGMTSIEQVHENLALWAKWYYNENTPKLDRLYTAMRIAMVALLVEFGASSWSWRAEDEEPAVGRTGQEAARQGYEKLPPRQASRRNGQARQADSAHEVESQAARPCHFLRRGVRDGRQQQEPATARDAARHQDQPGQ